jgi:hypothetical protein
MENTNKYIKEGLERSNQLFKKLLQEKKKKLGISATHSIWIMQKINNQWTPILSIKNLTFEAATTLFDTISLSGQAFDYKLMMHLCDEKGNVLDVTNIHNLFTKKQLTNEE